MHALLLFRKRKSRSTLKVLLYINRQANSSVKKEKKPILLIKQDRVTLRSLNHLGKSEHQKKNINIAREAMIHTYNDERSYDRNERNVRQGTLESVFLQMLFKTVAPHTRKAGDQNARHQHINHRHEHRQRRYQQRRHHCHHEEHRSNASPNLLKALASLRHNNNFRYNRCSDQRLRSFFRFFFLNPLIKSHRDLARIAAN